MTQVSPVTESEMNEWFKRLSTMVVNASQQALQLRDVQDQVQRLGERLESLRVDNEKLKREVAETWQLVTNVEKERDEYKAQVEQAHAEVESINTRSLASIMDYKEKLSQAHDALAQRDQRIAELEQQLVTARRESGDWQVKANENEITLNHVRDDNNYWRDRAMRAEQANSDLDNSLRDQIKDREALIAKLASVQAKLTEVTSIFAPPQAESVPTFPGWQPEVIKF